MRVVYAVKSAMCVCELWSTVNLYVLAWPIALSISSSHFGFCVHTVATTCADARMSERTLARRRQSSKLMRCAQSSCFWDDWLGRASAGAALRGKKAVSAVQ